MDAARDVVRAMDGEERRLLEIRDRQSRTSYRHRRRERIGDGPAGPGLARHPLPRPASAPGRAMAGGDDRARGAGVAADDAGQHRRRRDRHRRDGGSPSSIPSPSRLTGWNEAEARASRSRRSSASSTSRPGSRSRTPRCGASARDVVVGLANHTVLIARDGTEWPSTTAPPRSGTRRARHRLPCWSSATLPSAGRPSEAARGGGRPPQGRVPGHAGPRAAQPARPDPQRRADDADGPTTTAEVRTGPRHDGAPMAHLVRLVDDLLDVSRDYPRQDRAAQGAAGRWRRGRATPSRPAAR